MHWLSLTFFSGVALAALPLAAGAADDDAWFFDDAESRIDRVSEGELHFLGEPPARAVHHHHNILTIDHRSLQDGWVAMRQCHDNLDAVARAQILFRPGNIRNLSVTRQDAIGQAWVEDSSVQLEGVEPGARLCVDAESRVLSIAEDGTVSVRNGPFMRRFLDGYYPMQVSMDVHYPCEALELASVTPPAQEGFDVTAGDCQVGLDALFEGRLHTVLEFAPLP